MEQQNQSDLLQDVHQEMNYVDPVHWSVRFINYLVDQVAMGIIINGGKQAYKLVLTSKGQNYLDHAIFHEDMSGLMAGLWLSLAVTFSYYIIMEAATKGRTLGKLATGTIAITQDGTPFTFKHALLRTLCRFIPFEPFSAFGYMPWHDSVTKTVVVKKTW